MFMMKDTDRNIRRMPLRAVELRGAFSDTEVLQAYRSVPMTGV
jgi:hypothetical protein